jgi:hypothetical protein
MFVLINFNWFELKPTWSIVSSDTGSRLSINFNKSSASWGVTCVLLGTPPPPL